MEASERSRMGIRWRFCLGAMSRDDPEGSAKVAREKYYKLRKECLRDPRDDAQDRLEVNNPLSTDPGSSWNKYFNTKELEKLVTMDLERLHLGDEGDEVVKREDVQEVLCRVLMLWALQHPDVSYKQGMHELLAPLFLVLYRDAIAEGASKETRLQWDDETAIGGRLCDLRFVEHDSFLLFQALMEAPDASHAADKRMLLYFTEAGNSRSPGAPKKLTGGQRVYAILAAADPQVYHCLVSLEVEPQLFLLRWTRLLFGREFHLEDVIVLWDALFKAVGTGGGALESGQAGLSNLVEGLCVAMLMYVRNALLSYSDQGQALKRLMKFPPVEDLTVLVEEAMRLLPLTVAAPERFQAAHDPDPEAQDPAPRRPSAALPATPTSSHQRSDRLDNPFQRLGQPVGQSPPPQRTPPPQRNPYSPATASPASSPFPDIRPPLGHPGPPQPPPKPSTSPAPISDPLGATTRQFAKLTSWGMSGLMFGGGEEDQPEPASSAAEGSASNAGDASNDELGSNPVGQVATAAGKSVAAATSVIGGAFAGMMEAASAGLSSSPPVTSGFEAPPGPIIPSHTFAPPSSMMALDMQEPIDILEQMLKRWRDSSGGEAIQDPLMAPSSSNSHGIEDIATMDGVIKKLKQIQSKLS